ncbi:serine dehydratase alpha chain [Peptococcaceae bacterium CEB3]|nr:serine dehydratase alpha chain [Peptococcaceae bacterium CEB3]
MPEQGQEQELISLLRTEVKPALGCTEPAAVALAVATARDYLGGRIDRIKLAVSGNIYKNALAVTIPHTQEAGLEMAAVLGLLKGKADRGLEVFAGVESADVEEAKLLVGGGLAQVRIADREGIFIEAHLEGERGWAEVVIAGGHTQVVSVNLNGKSREQREDYSGQEKGSDWFSDEYKLSELVEQVEKFRLEDIEFLRDGLEMNLAMAELGLRSKPGLALGAGLKALIERGFLSDDVGNRARAAVAGACDARMAGMDHPVMSTMGSGNHGIVAIVTVAVLAREIGATEERTLRALALSHLVTAFVKQYTGRLSTMCGCAVAAGAGAAAAATWLQGGKAEQVGGAVQNIIGNLAGMICDGAKGGCAFKLSTAASEAILASEMALAGIIINPVDGIISPTVEDTVRNLGRLSSAGMTCAEKTILDIMLHKEKRAV